MSPDSDAGSRGILALRYPGATAATSAVDVLGPVVAAPTTALLLVHGGSWYRGDRSMYRVQQEKFAAAGHVVGSAGYSLDPGSVLADKLDDLRTGWRVFREHLATAWPTVRTVVVAGGSAGGHLAALLALDPDEQVFPDGVVSVYGPGRLDGWEPDPSLRESIDMLCGVAGVEDPEVVQAARASASPLTWLRSSGRRPPPFLIAQGSDDRTFPPEVVSGWATDLARAGAPVIVRVYPDTGHGFMINGSAAGPALLRDIDTFVREVDLDRSRGPRGS
ncbi:alpha/beta hydrolase [Nakamurella alba]|uniref:alpha/beta hydrolase n=1 Tax=Nakamurella alba TaxID=2665158 RepID=UPI0018AA93E8|nr:alpha/beta hydrolase [Nakamurella alba]